MGLPMWSIGYESASRCRGRGFDPWSGIYDPTCHRAAKESLCTTKNTQCSQNNQ